MSFIRNYQYCFLPFDLWNFKAGIKCKPQLFSHYLTKLFIIEGFGGKRAVGFLLKIELCRKCSKFRMQFCLGALNNVLYVFLLKSSSFSR